MNDLEEMSSFFNKRVNIYDKHMLDEVDGMKQAYIEIAKYIPIKNDINLIDIGCGTGLELEEIYRNHPDMIVTGIDLSKEMLLKLKEKFVDKNIILHNMSYFDFDYGYDQYNVAISSMTLHHFSHQEKIRLYKRLYDCLDKDGVYIQCDYMVSDQKLEDFYYSENERIRKEQGITEGFYHYDTPCTIDNERSLLNQAGFRKVEKVWNNGSTVILVCYK